MDHPNFPVHLTVMGAKMSFRDLREGEAVEIDAGDGQSIRVTTAMGNHPQGVYAFRVDYGGQTVVYATDTEHYEGRIDENLRRLSDGANVLIYDAQYTPEEYTGAGGGMAKKGWGHSTFEEAVKLAKAAGADRLVLYHHDPTQNDAAVREKEKRAQAIFPKAIAAYEGLSLEV
jgi:phosphoribosyl 1,2-cyclic phosphodiesterase